MKDEEIDFDQAKPINLQAEVTPEKTKAFFAGEKESPLQPKEITEEMLSKYFEMSQELDHLSKLVEMMRLDIKSLGKGGETIQRGKFVAMLKKVSGRKTMNWKRLVKELVGELSEADTEKYQEIGDESIRLEVRKLS